MYLPPRNTTCLRTAGSAARRRRNRLLAITCIALALPGAGVSAEETSAAPAQVATSTTQVAIPIRLDYPLLQQLLVAQVFTGANESREVLNDPSRCSEIVLSQPTLASGDAELELLADLSARIGVGANGACASILNWQGRIGIGGVPEIRYDGTALGFSPNRVWLLDRAGQPVSNPVLQSLAEAGVQKVFRGFVVDLTPQLQSVGDFLPTVLPQHSRAQIEQLLATLRISRLQVSEDTLDADIAFAVEPLAQPLTPEGALSDAEYALWEERWQLMDSLLVLTVKHYAAATQLQPVRDALLDALIESRYRLRDALLEPPGAGADTVRDWFLQSWRALLPSIRRIGLEQPGQEHMLLLSVIAATDALEALDQLGPGVGLDVSTNGVRRLARMIIGSEGDELLRYSEEVDPELRRLFEDSVRTSPPASTWRLSISLFPEALAADADRLNSWAPKRQDLVEYLPLVAELLNTSASKAAAERNLDPAYRELFRHMVLTTAWQESCWRHYVVSDDRKLVPLRSGTGDVGLMQVNERVWRGFYDPQRLRWDIEYNSATGAEVLIDYLVKYAIRKGEHRQPGGLANLARASYSAYNGGPSKVSRYRSSTASAYGKKVDGLFWQKYQQVAAGNELAVSGCLGGNLSGPATAAKKPVGSASATSSGFTLQLGAFTTETSARSFIRQHTLGSAARVQKRSKGDVGQYLVIYGDYPTREQAEIARQRLANLAPWIRDFGDL